MKPSRAMAATGLLLLGAAVSAPAQQRNPLQKIGETVVDRPSAHYRFEREVIRSADGRRSWRIHIGIPRQAPPERGFPALYMLDGNAALMNFDEALLGALAAATPQVLVFIGYDNDLRIDSAARTRDYTPLLAPAEEQEQEQEQEQGQAQAPDATGGADAFLDVIERQVRPAVARRAPLDLERQALWGHSLGGLLVLHTLFTRGGAFQAYAAASPSLWWQEGYLLQEEARFTAHNAGHPARVLMMLGGDERQGKLGNRDMSNPRVLAHLQRIAAVPPDSAARMAERLERIPGLEVEYLEFEGLGHGPMLRASLLATLEKLAGVKVLPPSGAEPSGPREQERD